MLFTAPRIRQNKNHSQPSLGLADQTEKIGDNMIPYKQESA
jgi:hypothetical protein